MWLTLTWDVLKCISWICVSVHSLGLTLTWDVLKCGGEAQSKEYGFGLTLTWDVLKFNKTCHPYSFLVD